MSGTAHGKLVIWEYNIQMRVRLQMKFAEAPFPPSEVSLPKWIQRRTKQ